MASTYPANAQSATVDQQSGRQDWMNMLMSRNGIMAAGAVLVVLFLLSRRGGDDSSEKAARKFVRDLRKVDSVDDGREHLQSTLLPVLKPVLMVMLSELEDLVEKAFHRANREVKRL